MPRPHARFCTNITKKERIFQRTFNRTRWSTIPVRRIQRIKNKLDRILEVRRQNNYHYQQISQGTNPATEKTPYPHLDYTTSEYESESSDNESVLSNEDPPLRKRARALSPPHFPLYKPHLGQTSQYQPLPEPTEQPPPELKNPEAAVPSAVDDEDLELLADSTEYHGEHRDDGSDNSRNSDYKYL